MLDRFVNDKLHSRTTSLQRQVNTHNCGLQRIVWMASPQTPRLGVTKGRKTRKQEVRCLLVYVACVVGSGAPTGACPNCGRDAAIVDNTVH